MLPTSRRLLVFALFASTLPAQKPAPSKISTQVPLTAATVLPAAGLQEDVAILRTTFEQLHPGLYRYNNRQQMDAAFDQLGKDFSRDRTLQETFVRLSEFTAQIRCGHTWLNVSNQLAPVTNALFERADKLPFFFRWIDGRMIVTQDFTLDQRLPRGTEIVAINGVGPEEVLRKLLPLVSADGGNDAKRLSLLELRGESAYEATDVYLPMVFPQWSLPFRLKIRVPSAKVATSVSEPALSFAQRKQAVDAAHPDERGFAQLFSTRYLPNDAALLTMPTWVMFNSKWDWKTWLNGALDEAIDRKAPALIVDLRGNAGGDDVGDVILTRLRTGPEGEAPYARLVRYRKVPGALLPHLSTWDRTFKDWGTQAVDLSAPWPTAPPVSYLRQVPEAEPTPSAHSTPVKHFQGKVFVLTDAANSSATFNFARTIQKEHLGLLAGGPTGGNQRGINGGAFFFVTLPHSGLEIDLPLIGYFPAALEPDSGLLPDTAVKTLAGDIAQGHDPLMDRVEQLLAKK